MDGLELVIFDCDGVLVDSEGISNAVLARMLTEEGMATTLAEARRDFQGLLLSEVVSRVQARLGRSLPEGWIERFERDRAEVFHRELRPVPGAAETVARVSAAGVAVCVASQGRVSLWRYRHKASYVARRVMSCLSCGRCLLVEVGSAGAS